MKTLSEYEELAAKAHGHMCAGQIIGLRMAIHGMNLLGFDDPTGAQRKRLITYVEIDRCATDAITVVTGCRLGKRSLKFLDFGKMAATFCDLETGKAVRIAALETSRDRARELHPEIEDKGKQQTVAYREMNDDELFSHEWVHVEIDSQDLPGGKSPRAACSSCGERINFGRGIGTGEATLCRACAGERYYSLLHH
jgi:formylmethanofuran dehydrogenase subunit E